MSDEQEMKESLAEQMARSMGMVGASDEELGIDDDEFDAVLNMKEKLKPLPQLQEDDRQFDFDADFQQKLVALSLRDEAFFRRVDGLIQPQ